MSDCYSRKQRMMHWIAKQNVILTILTVHFSGIRDVISCPQIPCPKGLVKKYLGAGPEQRARVGHEVFSLEQGVGLTIFSSPQVVGHPILLHRQALTTNETVDYTCYIKHSQLELLLKYSETSVLCEKIQRVTGRRPIQAWNHLLTFFFFCLALTSMSFNDFPFL